jgi:ATP/maltotriose-dependent transcriptional regulator MalT
MIRHNQGVNPVEDPVVLGKAALQRGDWAGARRHFETAIGDKETGPALDGLSDALFYLEELEPSLHHRSRAFAKYREEGDLCRAARAALWLAIGYISAYGNAAVANGWLQRAERLVEEAGPCAERGWLEQLRGKMTPDPAVTARHARQAVEIARQHRDADLEVWALSEEGRALVSLGRVDEGMAMLDEAVTAATAGDARSPLIVGNTCCNMLSACDRAADVARAVQWCQVVDEFTRRYHCPPVFNYCRVVYSGVLIATGRWDEAEQELKTALRAVERTYPLEKVHSLSRLALLSVKRGRFEEAGQMLAGLETHGLAAEASALLHLARGQAALAVALLERRIEALGDVLAAVPLLRLLADAKLSVGEIEAAARAASRLSTIADRSKRPPLQAVALLTSARVQMANGEAAHVALERASSLFDELGMPFEAAIARLELARALLATDREIACEDARLALMTFERLGAKPDADRAAALMRELGAGSRPGPHVTGVLTRREKEVLELLSHGLSNTQIGGRLFISPKTVEHHVGRILSKLGLHSRAEAIAWVLRHAPAKTDAK